MSLLARSALAWVIVAVSGGLVGAQEPPPRPSAVERLAADVRYLADDAQEGRGPGTDGIERAAEHIAAQFREAGLKPAAGLSNYFQPFTIVGSTKLGEGQKLAVASPNSGTIDAEMRKDFLPLAIGSGGTLEGVPVVFAGYGITAKDEAKGLDYDDYAGLDVKGKVVLVLRRAPGHEQPGSRFGEKDGQPSSFATFQHKATNAFQHGAAAILIVNDLAGLKGEPDQLMLFTSAGTERYSNLPVLQVSRAFAGRLLEAAGSPNLEELERTIAGEGKPASQELKGLAATMAVNIEQETIACRNVVGVLEGKGPHAEETIVIGAHYDHLGKGGRGSLAPFSSEIHNGADDNASGTAMLIEMARRLGSRPDPLPRRVVFMAFSAEERGLLGSRHYVNDAPLYPLKDTVAMINFDMVGRLSEKNELTLYGVDSTPGLRELVVAMGPSYGLKVEPNKDVAGNSDHDSFYRKDVPVAFLFTGTHRDYHRPSDDVDKINVDGMARIADFAEVLSLDLARRPARPEFKKIEVATTARPVSGSRVSLGTIPDYDESVKGVRLNGVREGSPAEKAGMKGGDVIIGLGGKPVGTIYDMMEAMGGFKPGDEVEVVVQREGKEVKLKAQLDAATRRPANESNN